MRQAMQLPKIYPQQIILAGGLDVMTPPMQAKPGMLRACQNFECSIFGGYRRIAGYERFDGRSKPSDATYTILAATSITGGSVGDTLTGATSGATGKIIAITATYFVLTQTSLTFQAEDLNVGGPTIAVSSGAGVINGASTPALNATYKNLAADVYRALIGAVPGSGAILGVNWYNDVLYAFRNNVGGTAAALYKSTTGGWSAVALGREIAFTSGGTTEIAEGDVITGATSGAFATVTRVVKTSGTWAGGDAAGYFYFASQTGTFQAENLNVGVTLNLATIAGDSTAITLLPGGRYEFVNANFTGSTDTFRMYGCDGVNLAFEFDGDVFVRIRTGMATDTPSHIAFHLYHLFLSFYGSVQHSSPGFPYLWTPVTGASELSMGEDVTGFQVQPAGTTAAALAIFTKGRLSILYGTGSSDWALLPYRDQIGAYPYTMQTLAQTVFLDIQGLTDIRTVQEFGNFAHAVLTNSVKSVITDWRRTASASNLARDLSQYRIFFTNGYGLYVTMVGQKVIGITPVLFPDIVRCATSGYTSDGTEVSFFGSDEGYVYQMDKGTSFDGDAIEAYIYLHYNFVGGLRTLKRFWDITLEVSGSAYASFSLGYALGYGATTIIQPSDQTVVTNFASVYWDAFTWDAFTWDGVTLSPSLANMEGEAENVSLSVVSNSDEFEPFTLTGAVMHYSPRREIRV